LKFSDPDDYQPYNYGTADTNFHGAKLGGYMPEEDVSSNTWTTLIEDNGGDAETHFDTDSFVTNTGGSGSYFTIPEGWSGYYRIHLHVVGKGNHHVEQG